MSLAHSVAGLLISLQLAGELSVPLEPHRLAELDERVILPQAARAKHEYVRLYALSTGIEVEQLPFTTLVDDLPIPEGPYLLGLFVLPADEWDVPGPPGPRLVASVSSLPQVVHGGCLAVNVIMNLETGETVASWCNIDRGQPSGPPPPGTPSPVYLPAR